MSRPRIGIIGGGGIATAHLPRLKERADEVELAAMADINPAARQLADQYGIPRFASDWREIVPEVDAVIICVPTHLHSDITIESLRQSKHVFCEKPLTRTIEQARAVAAAAKESRGTLQIGFVRRFDDEWLAFRETIQASRIGRPVVWRHVAAGAGPGIRWFNQEEQGGGPFIDGTIHNYDFGLFTFGPVEWVFAHLRTMRPGNTALDTGTATLRFESGDELALAWSWGLPKLCTTSGVFDFLGPEGSITWNRTLPENSPHGEFVIQRESGQQAVQFPRKALQEGFRRQMDEFIDVIHGRAKPRAGLEQGYESLRVSLAVLESGRTGRKVYLSEVK